MTWSPTMLAALTAQNTGEVILNLVQIRHPEFAETIYLTDNGADIIHNGVRYTAEPFVLIEPENAPNGGIPTLRIAMQNVTRRVTQALRSIAGFAPVEIRRNTIVASEPNRALRRWQTVQVRVFPYDEMTVSAEVAAFPVLENSIQKIRFDAARFPGLF